MCSVLRSTLLAIWGGDRVSVVHSRHDQLHVTTTTWQEMDALALSKSFFVFILSYYSFADMRNANSFLLGLPSDIFPVFMRFFIISFFVSV